MRIFKNIVVPCVFFLLGGVVCWFCVSARVKKLQMYIDPQGRGMFIFEDGHLVGLRYSKHASDSFDAILKDSGFFFFFSHEDPRLSYECVDSDGDGFLDKVLLRHGDEHEIKERLGAVTLERISDK